jgi:hypothetical protein
VRFRWLLTGGILKEKRQLWQFKIRRQKRWHFKGLPFYLRLFASMTQVFSVVVPMTQRFVFVPITQEKNGFG